MGGGRLVGSLGGEGGGGWLEVLAVRRDSANFVKTSQYPPPPASPPPCPRKEF